jgi:archaellum component FlaC
MINTLSKGVIPINVSTVQLITYAIFAVFVGILLLGCYILFLLLKKKKVTFFPEEESEQPKTYEEPAQSLQLVSTKKEKKAAEEKDTSIKLGELLLTFDKVSNDMIINQNPAVCAMVVHCQGINFGLMSKFEKSLIEEAYVDFIKSIDIPFQIHVQSRVVLFQNNISSFERRIKHIESELKELVNQFNKAHAELNADKKELAKMVQKIQKKQKLYEYAKQIKAQIEKVSKNNTIIKNSYYIIISSTVKELGISNLKSPKNLESANAQMHAQCERIIEALRRCQITSNVLNSNQLVELLYNSFVQDHDGMLALREAIEAGFFKLYSTK